MKQIDLKNYTKFVDQVTSKESNNYDHLSNRISELRNNDNLVNISLLMTAAIGLGSETGEFQEIVKKILFQGKPLNEENVFHMKRELGDIMWYWINACRSLNLDPNDVILENINKLKSRYPNQEFNPWYSENRKENDL